MTEFVDTALLSSHARLIAYVGSLLLKATAVLALAWLVSLFLRKRSAGLRHLLWSAAMAAVLALPLISAWVPPLEVDLSRFDVLSERIFPAPEESGARSVELLSGTAAVSGESTGLSLGAGDVEGRAAGEDTAGVPIAAYLLYGWMAGAGVLLLIFAMHIERIRRATRNALAKERMRALSTHVSDELGISRVPRVLVGEVEMPITWGLFRPVVLLPVEAGEWDEQRLRIVLMHELAHIRRLDYLPHLLAELSCIAYWPNPLVWIARHRLRTEQEQACDDFVLRTGTASHDYAELLLDIARSVQGRRLLPGGVRMAERKGLKARIQAILDPSVERDTASLLAFVIVIAAVAIPALSAGALRSADPEAPSDESTKSSPPAEQPSNVEPPEIDEDPAPAVFTLTVEAESGRLTAPMKVREDDRASGSRYVEVPDQKGHDPPDGGPGSVAFDLDLGEFGAQAVWVRALGEHDNDNSFFVSVDGGEEFRWDIREPNRRDLVKQWTWLPLTDRSGRPLRIEPGHHTLTFRNREDGSRLDAVFVTSDPGLVPNGRSPLPPPDRSVSVAVEAEEPINIVAPFEIRTDERAAGRLFMTVARGFGSRRRPPSDGRLAYRVDVPEGGRYVIWARAMGPDDDEDSFWIRVNDQDWVRWNGIQDDDDWEWQLVVDDEEDAEVAVFSLHPGANTLEIAYREAGARIDRMVVTNNMYVHPSAHGSGVADDADAGRADDSRPGERSDDVRPDVTVTFRN